MEQLNYAIRKEQTVIGSACAERQGLYWRVTAEAAAEPDGIVRIYAHLSLIHISEPTRPY